MEVDEEPTLEELAAMLERADTEQVAVALAAALQVGWEQQVERALALAVEQQVRTLQAFTAILQDQLRSQMRRAVARDVRVAVESLYAIGQREVGSPGLTPAGRRTITFMDDYTTFWVENHYDRFVQRRIQSVSRDALQEGLSAFRAGRQFADSPLGRQFSKSQSYWELLANATATRTRELAHIDGFVQAGVEEVEINAVLDSRTSCICRTLDGTRIPVEALAEFKEEMLSTDDPTEIKEEVSPWLECSRIQALKRQGPEALADAGVVAPPFHGHCRSTLSVPLDA